MEAYLIGSNGRRYTMQDVGAMVFGDENDSFTVSLIHQCYNFSEQDGGKYCNDCKFEQMYSYRVTRSDIEAFVQQYPNGTFGSGVIFEDFLISRVNQPRSAPVQQSASRSKMQRPEPPQIDYQDYGGQPPVNMKPIMFVVGGIGVLILLFLLKSGGLF